ncbi:hypothetical protein I317_05196 [Kwoniella heveanensis CBS 569]|nr:hypothetical protein I317_05196 [Kwoniella heveanensis CBS 569]
MISIPSNILAFAALLRLLTPALAVDESRVQATVHLNFPFDTSYLGSVNANTADADAEEISPRPHDFVFTIGDINRAKNGTDDIDSSVPKPGGENGGENINRDGWVTKDFQWLIYEQPDQGIRKTINPRVVYNSSCYVSISPALHDDLTFSLLRDPPLSAAHATDGISTSSLSVLRRSACLHLDLRDTHRRKAR